MPAPLINKLGPPPSDEQILHAAAGLVAFFGLVPGAGLVSCRLRVAGRLSGSYRWLRPLSWLMPVRFIAMAVVFHPRGFAGLGQRIFLVLAFTWVILAARGLAEVPFCHVGKWIDLYFDRRGSVSACGRPIPAGQVIN